MKLAIHDRINSFSDFWIDYCKMKDIDYIIVNCFDSQIINILKEEKITHLMWNFHHTSINDLVVSNYVLNSVENIGIKTFPNFNTRWHFDDKIAQKYLLESLNVPIVPSHVFYNKSEAIKNMENLKYPIVAKLKRGAGSSNVKLLKNKKESLLYLESMFGVGLNPNPGTFGLLDQKFRIAKKIKNPVNLFKRAVKYIIKNYKEIKINVNEKGYFYFQDFMPNNDYDTRVIIVGDKAVAFKRFNKDNDFRASGSGKSSFEDIDEEMIKIAFETSKKIGAQSLAYDFVYNKMGKPVIIEISYNFGRTISSTAKGHWNNQIEYIEGSINLQYLMIERFLNNDF